MFSFMARQTDLRMPNGDIKGWIPIPKQAAALRMEASEEVHQSIENPRLYYSRADPLILYFFTDKTLWQRRDKEAHPLSEVLWPYF